MPRAYPSRLAWRRSQVRLDQLLAKGPPRPPKPQWLVFLTLLGPGLIAANAGNDAGGIATYASVGAKYGYDLLWMMVVITLSLCVVQEMCARLGAVTGKGFADLVRERYGVKWTAFVMLALVVANTGTTISEFAGIAAAAELFGIPRWIAVPPMAALVWWLVVKGSYAKVERVFLVLTIVFLAYPISAWLAGPDWLQVAKRTVVPSFRLEAEYLTLFVATVGTTITPYMQLFQQSSVVEKGVTVRNLPFARADAVVGSILSNVVAYFIIVATAATLFVSGQHDVETAADAAKALGPVAGQYATYLFAVGLFGASMLAAGVLPLATAFTICEAFGWEKGVTRDLHEAPSFYRLFTGLLVIGAVVALIPGLPLITLLLAVQVVNGVLLPIELVFIVKLAGNRRLMREHANGRVLGAVAWTTTVVIGALAITMLVVSFLLPALGVRLGG